MLELQSQTEAGLLKSGINDTNAKTLGDWLDQSSMKNQMPESPQAEQLSVGLHKKNKSSRIAPMPMIIDEAGSDCERSLHSHRQDDDISYEEDKVQSEPQLLINPDELQKVINVDSLSNLDVDLNGE